MSGLSNVKTNTSSPIRKLSGLLAEYANPSTTISRLQQVKTELKRKYPSYRNNGKCKDDALRFIANVGGRWRFWYQVFPQKGYQLRSGAIPKGTRDVFHPIANRWYVTTHCEPKTAASSLVPCLIELKTGMVVGTAEKKSSTGKWLNMHHWVWLGGKGPLPEIIEGVRPQKISNLDSNLTFWNGDFFIIIRVYDPFDSRSK